MKRISFPVWILFMILIALRMLLPLAGLKAVNWVLAEKLGTYEGHIEDFDLNLYRGAYQLQKLEIKKRNSRLAPLLSIEEVDLSIAWRALLQRHILLDVQIRQLVLNAIDSKKEEKRQLGTEEKGWQDVLNALVPLSVESLTIENSSAYFTNQDLLKALPVKMEKINLRAADLQSHANRAEDSLSPFEMTALLQEHAQLKIEGKIDVLAKKPRFDIDFSFLKFHPKTINGLLLTYVPLDLTSGEISIYGETAASHGEIKGYINLFLKDVDVIAPQQKIISTRHFFIELLSAFANWALKNKNQNIATHIPFERHNGKSNVDAGTAFWSTVENKKDQLKMGFENSISLKNIETGTKNEKL